MDFDDVVCVSCGAAVPDESSVCDQCGAPQGQPGRDVNNRVGVPESGETPVVPAATDSSGESDPAMIEPDDRSSRPAFLTRPLIIAGLAAVGVVAIGVIAAVLLASGGSQGEITVAYVKHDKGGDLYLVGSAEDAATVESKDRFLRDVTVGGTVEAADGGRIVLHDPFDFMHEGDPFFAYTEDGDDEWILAVLDGSEVVELERSASEPQLYVTNSGFYTIIERGASCVVFRLEGHSSQRIATADYCGIKTTADLALLGDEDELGMDLSVMRLDSQQETKLGKFDHPEDVLIAYSPSGELVMASDFDEAVIVDSSSGEVVVEQPVVAQWITDTGFFGFDPEELSDSETTLTYYPFEGSPREIVTTATVDLMHDTDATTFAVIQGGDEAITLSMAYITNGEVGPLIDIKTSDTGITLDFDGSENLLVADKEGNIELLDGDQLVSVGQLDAENGESPQVAAVAANTWLVGVSGSGGIVLGGPTPKFVAIEEIMVLSTWVVSPDGRWLAVVGGDDTLEADLAILLIDLETGEYRLVEEAVDIGFIQYSGDYLYYETFDDANGEQGQTRRTPISLDAGVETVAEQTVVFVPGEPIPIL